MTYLSNLKISKTLQSNLQLCEQGVVCTPPTLVNTQPSDESLYVEWDAPVGESFSGYNVYIDGEFVTTTTNTNYLFYNSDPNGSYSIAPETTYDITINTACDNGGEGGFEVSLTTLASNPDSGLFLLTWTPSSSSTTNGNFFLAAKTLGSAPGVVVSEGAEVEILMFTYDIQLRLTTSQIDPFNITTRFDQGNDQLFLRVDEFNAGCSNGVFVADSVPSVLGTYTVGDPLRMVHFRSTEGFNFTTLGECGVQNTTLQCLVYVKSGFVSTTTQSNPDATIQG